MISKVSNNFGISNSSQAFRAVDLTTTTATDAQATTTTSTSENDSFSSTTTPTPTELAPKGVNWLGVAAVTGVTGLAIIGGHKWGSASTLRSIENGLKEIPGAVKVLEDDVELNSVDKVVELLGKENKRASGALDDVLAKTTELNNTRIDLESQLKQAQNALDNMTIEKKGSDQDVTRLNQEVTALKQQIDDLQKPKGVKSEAPKSEAPKSEAPKSEAPKHKAPDYAKDNLPYIKDHLEGVTAERAKQLQVVKSNLVTDFPILDEMSLKKDAQVKTDNGSTVIDAMLRGGNPWIFTNGKTRQTQNYGVVISHADKNQFQKLQTSKDPVDQARFANRYLEATGHEVDQTTGKPVIHYKLHTPLYTSEERAVSNLIHAGRTDDAQTLANDLKVDYQKVYDLDPPVTPVAVVGQNPVAEVVVPQKKGFIEQAKEFLGIGNPDDLGIEVGRKALNLELPSSHTFNKKPLGEGFELQTVDGVNSFVPKGSYGDVIIKIGQTNHGFPIYGFPEI